MQVIHLNELAVIPANFSSSNYQPLKITLQTLQPIVGTEPLHLDGLLAKVVVTEAMQGKPLPQTPDAYFIPLPIGIERMIDGLPLWQSTDFMPVGAKSDHTHYHQRGDCNPYDYAASKLSRRKQPPTTEGQYMSYRIPIKRTIADRWEATCVGDRALVEKYLSTMQYVGKKHSQGYGRVLKWNVSVIPEFELKNRPIPMSQKSKIVNFVMMGWTPPYWHRALWRLCHVS
jgi:CRISPR type IV-associated protein Csf3